MADRIQHRRDTADRWASINPILLEGEIGYVTDNPNQYKIGDGIHRWNDLPLRGFTGTISQELGDDENAVISQKVVSEKIEKMEMDTSELNSHLFDVANISSIKLTPTNNAAQKPAIGYTLKKGVEYVVEIEWNLIEGTLAYVGANTTGSGAEIDKLTGNLYSSAGKLTTDYIPTDDMNFWVIILSSYYVYNVSSYISVRAYQKNAIKALESSLSNLEARIKENKSSIEETNTHIDEVEGELEKLSTEVEQMGYVKISNIEINPLSTSSGVKPAIGKTLKKGVPYKVELEWNLVSGMLGYLGANYTDSLDGMDNVTGDIYSEIGNRIFDYTPTKDVNFWIVALSSAYEYNESSFIKIKVYRNAEIQDVIDEEINTVKNRLTELTALSYGRNIFIKSDATLAGYISPGGILDESFGQYGWRTTKHFVNVEPNAVYKYSNKGNNAAIVFYDSDKNYISHKLSGIGTIEGSITTPTNARFAKFSTNDLSNFIISKESDWENEYIEGEYPEVKTTEWGLPLKNVKSSGGSEVIVSPKKIATLGDSITYRGNYQSIISKFTGYSFVNYGISGAGVEAFPYHLNRDSWPYVVDRILDASDFEGVDAIVICGYANSIWNKLGSMESPYVTIDAELANASNPLSEYRNTIIANGVIPAFRSVIEYLIKICPSIPIMLASELPMSRPKEHGQGATNSVDFDRVYDGSNATLKDFADAMKQVAEHYSIPFVDLHRQGQINALNYQVYYDGSDTTHPNMYEFDMELSDYPNSGMKRMATLILDGLNKVVIR